MLNYQQEYTLALLQENAQAKEETFKVLDQKAQQNIAMSSVLLVFVNIFKLDVALFTHALTWQEAGLLLALLSYIIAFLFAYLAITPKTWLHPMRASLEDTAEFLALSPEEFYVQLLDLYVGVNETNGRTLGVKARYVRWSTLCVGMMVLFLVLAAVIGS